MITIQHCDKVDGKLYDQFITQVAEVEKRVQKDTNWTRETIAKLLVSEHNHLLIARSDEQGKPIVGYCLYQSMFESSEILRMGTHPKWQRQGVAHQLLSLLMDYLKQTGTEKVLLEVRVDNTPARKLYQKNNFEVIDVRKGYYKSKKNPNERVDAEIMQAVLC